MEMGACRITHAASAACAQRIASAFSIKKTSRHQGNPVRIINCMDIFPGEHEVYEDNIRILENIRMAAIVPTRGCSFARFTGGNFGADQSSGDDLRGLG